MNEQTQPNWDERFGEPGRWCGEEPQEFLRRHLGLLPRGRALELAMGEGRNAIFLAQQGYQVTGIDKSPVGVAKARDWARELGLQISAVAADLENYTLPVEAFDLVVSTYYLQRSLFPQMERALKPGGALFIETYTIEQLERAKGPRNPDYLLQPNELYRAFRHLRVAYYREIEDDRRAVATLLAFRP